jgi:hypothetical protein
MPPPYSHPEDPRDLRDVSKAVAVAAPELRTIAKTITVFSSIELIQDNIAGHIEEERNKLYYPTVFVITTNDRMCMKPAIEAVFAQSSF